MKPKRNDLLHNQLKVNSFKAGNLDSDRVKQAFHKDVAVLLKLIGDFELLMAERAKAFGKTLDRDARRLIFAKISGEEGHGLVGIQQFYSFLVNYKISNNQNDAIFLFKRLLNNKHSKTLTQEDFFGFFGCQQTDSSNPNRPGDSWPNQLLQHSYGRAEYLLEEKACAKKPEKPKPDSPAARQKENVAPKQATSHKAKPSPSTKPQEKKRIAAPKESPNFNIISFDKDFQCVTNPGDPRANIQETADTNYLSEDPFFTEGLISKSDYESKQRQTSTKDHQSLAQRNFTSSKSYQKPVQYTSNRDEDIGYLRLSKVETPFSSSHVRESRDLTPDLEQAGRKRQDRLRSRTPATYIEAKKSSQDHSGPQQGAPKCAPRSPSVSRNDSRQPADEVRAGWAPQPQPGRPSAVGQAAAQELAEPRRARNRSPVSPLYTSTPSGRKPAEDPRSRDHSTNYKFERVESAKASATKRSSTPIISLRYDREKCNARKEENPCPTSSSPSPFKSNIPKKGRTISQQAILELLILESKLESYKIALSHSKDFNISHLFESVDSELNGFITKSQLFKLLESLSIEVDRKAFEDFFLHIIDKRPRITFINFSKLFYPVSSLQFEVMRKKMYSYASCPDYQMTPVTRSALSTFFQLHLSFGKIKDTAREHYKAGDFQQFLKELTSKHRPHLELRDLESDYEMSAFPDDIKKKVFETLDRNYNSKVCEEDFLHFLDL